MRIVMWIVWHASAVWILAALHVKDNIICIKIPAFLIVLLDFMKTIKAKYVINALLIVHNVTIILIIVLAVTLILIWIMKTNVFLVVAVGNMDLNKLENVKIVLKIVKFANKIKYVKYAMKDIF